MILNHRLIPRIAGLLACAAMMTASAHADVIITMSGTTASPTLTATVTNGDSFTTGAGGILVFLLGPNVFDITYVQDGPLGPYNPGFIRGPADGSYLNVVQLSSGDISDFTLDASHPYTTSGFAGDPVSSLAVFNGVTSTMPVETGSGPTTNVTFIYNVTAAPVVPEPSTLLMMFTAALPGAGWMVRRRRA